MADAFAQAIGLIAGAIVTLAAVPRIVDIIRSPVCARGEFYVRNSLLVLGNVIWTIYGIRTGALAIVMCGFNSLLNCTILCAAVYANASCCNLKT